MLADRILYIMPVPSSARARPGTGSPAEVSPMKVRYFSESDTLLIEFSETAAAERYGLDDNTLLDLDARGNIRAITIEHASEYGDALGFSHEEGAGPARIARPVAEG